MTEGGDNFVNRVPGIRDFFIYGFLLLMTLATTESKHRDTNSWHHKKGCNYLGAIYKEGENMIVNCTNCTCMHGNMNCNTMECPKDPQCVIYETLPGSCCPQCMERGCFHKGKGYPRGARIPAPHCHYCFCPWEGTKGGVPICTKVQCPPARCVDGTVPDGKCCPACPNGSNCWMGDLLIPYGEEIWISPCRSCLCQQEIQNGYTELKAKCSWQFKHETCPYGK